MPTHGYSNEATAKWGAWLYTTGRLINQHLIYAWGVDHLMYAYVYSLAI